MGVSGNSVAGKSFQIFTVSEELLAKVTEAVQAGEKEARSSGNIQSFEVFCHGFRQNISLGRIMVVPAAVCNSRETFPTALLHGALVRIFGWGGEEIGDLIDKKIGDSEFDEYSQADYDSLKEKLFVDEKTGKEACLIVFAPNWMNSREYVCFHFTKDAEKLKNNLRHQVFAAYYNPAVSSAFNALMTNVDTTKVDVTDITPKISYPFISENVLKEYPRLDKQAGYKKATILLNRKTADEITKQTLDPQELDVFDSLNQALEQSLLPDADGAQGEGGYTAPEATPGVPREASDKKEASFKLTAAFIRSAAIRVLRGEDAQGEHTIVDMNGREYVLRGSDSDSFRREYNAISKPPAQVNALVEKYMGKLQPYNQKPKAPAAPTAPKNIHEPSAPGKPDINSWLKKQPAMASAKKGDVNPPASHETPFTNVGPGTEAHADQKAMVPAAKESLDDAIKQNDDKATEPIGIAIDENGVPRRKEEEAKVGAKKKHHFGPCTECKASADSKIEKDGKTYYGHKPSCSHAKAAGKVAHIDAKGNCPGCKKAGKDCSCQGCTCKAASNPSNRKHDSAHPETQRVDPTRLSSAYSAAYNGGFVDKHAMPPQKVREAMAAVGDNTKPAPHAAQDHAKQIEAGVYGDDPLNRRANEKWGGAEVRTKRGNKEVMADYIADVVATEIDEPSESMSHKAKQARAKNESLLNKFRPKTAVELDIDSIWDAITEDMGPAPLVDVDADPTNPNPPNTDNRDGFELTTPENEGAGAEAGESEAKAPSTAPNKRDTGNLPEAFRSDKPEEAKEVSDSEAEQQETDLENDVTKSEEHHESSWRVDAKLADFVGEVADEIEAEEELPGQRVSCDQCQMLSIQGVPCHEQGCPNQGARWDSDSGNWVEQRKCTECGSTVNADDPCCSAEEYHDRMDEVENEIALPDGTDYQGDNAEAVAQTSMASEKEADDNEPGIVEKAVGTAIQLAPLLAGKRAASDVLKKKLHPSRFPGMSGKMTAIVGYILGETYTDPSFTEMAITSDGIVMGQHSGDVGMNDMVGSVSDLKRNWDKLLSVAGLDPKEKQEAEGLFKSSIRSYMSHEGSAKKAEAFGGKQAPPFGSKDKDDKKDEKSKKADTADNGYDIDSAANPESKENGPSQTVECHQDYNTEMSEGTDRPKPGAGADIKTAGTPNEDAANEGCKHEWRKDGSCACGARRGKQSADISGDAAEAKAETVSPDTVDSDIQQPTVSVEDAAHKNSADKVALHFMNEYDIDEAVQMLGNDPVLGKAVRFLAAFKEQVNSHSDGWAYWRAPVAAANGLMTLIEAGMAKRRGNNRSTEPEVVIDDRAIAKAMGPIKAFMTRRGLAAGMEMPKLAFDKNADVAEETDQERAKRLEDQRQRDARELTRRKGADISGDISEAKSEVDYNKAEVADEPAATDTVNPEHFASFKLTAEFVRKAAITVYFDGEEAHVDMNGRKYSLEGVDAYEFEEEYIKIQKPQGQVNALVEKYLSKLKPEKQPSAPKNIHEPSAPGKPDINSWLKKQPPVNASKKAGDIPVAQGEAADEKQPKSDLSGAAPEAHEVPAQVDSKQAAAGDDQPESAEFDFGAGDLAGIVVSEDVDE